MFRFIKFSLRLTPSILSSFSSTGSTICNICSQDPCSFAHQRSKNLSSTVLLLTIAELPRVPFTILLSSSSCARETQIHPSNWFLVGSLYLYTPFQGLCPPSRATASFQNTLNLVAPNTVQVVNSKTTILMAAEIIVLAPEHRRLAFNTLLNPTSRLARKPSLVR